MNLKLKEQNIVLNGRVLDLGGRGKDSYLRFLNLGSADIIRLDIDESVTPDKKIDFEKEPLPYANDSIDNILAFNLFEHIYNHGFLVREIFRVLKPGGRLIGSVPFLVKIHPDPNDYFRYSSQALETLFRETGFQEIQIKYVGAGPFVSQYSQTEFILPRACRVICAYFHLWLDKLFLLLKPGFNSRFPLSFLFIAQKRD